MSRIIGLQLTPLDGLFCRDGRPFDAASTVGGGLPTPQTLAGAVYAALLERHAPSAYARALDDGSDRPVREKLQAAAPWIPATQLAGPWLARSTAPHEPLLPVPAILAQESPPDGPVYRSHPLPAGELPGWTGERLPLWRRDGREAKAANGFLTWAG